ncbi:MAG: hypothetical protein IPN92_15635 [Chromatiaceae bacterium]|nr:hypothetical protein [Chromatiaceae bacterium]
MTANGVSLAAVTFSGEDAPGPRPGWVAATLKDISLAKAMTPRQKFQERQGQALQ